MLLAYVEHVEPVPEVRGEGADVAGRRSPLHHDLLPAQREPAGEGRARVDEGGRVEVQLHDVPVHGLALAEAAAGGGAPGVLARLDAGREVLRPRRLEGPGDASGGGEPSVGVEQQHAEAPGPAGGHHDRGASDRPDRPRRPQHRHGLVGHGPPSQFVDGAPQGGAGGVDRRGGVVVDLTRCVHAPSMPGRAGIVPCSTRSDT